MDQLNVGQIGTGFTARRQDSIVDPRKGYSAAGRVEVAHPALSPGLAAALWRVVAETSGTYPLLNPSSDLIGPVVIAGTLEYGVARPFGDTERLPRSEAFTYGGDYSFRGATKRASLVQTERASYLFLASTELRWYFLENFGLGALQLAAFVDVASVSNELEHLFRDTAVSVGPGLRWVSPVGPISLDLGIPVVEPEVLSDELNVRLHITFGYSF